MAKKHKKRNGMVKYVGPKRPPGRGPGSSTRGKDGKVLKSAAAAAAGGAAGALAAGIAVSSGVSPKTAAIVMLVVGGAGAYGTRGNMRMALIGATAMGAGQLALTYYVQQRATQDAKAQAAEAKRLNEGVIDTTATTLALREPARPSEPAAAPAAKPAEAAPVRRQGLEDGYDDDFDDARNVGELPDYDDGGGAEDGYAEAA